MSEVTWDEFCKGVKKQKSSGLIRCNYGIRIYCKRRIYPVFLNICLTRFRKNCSASFNSLIRRLLVASRSFRLKRSKAELQTLFKLLDLLGTENIRLADLESLRGQHRAGAYLRHRSRISGLQKRARQSPVPGQAYDLGRSKSASAIILQILACLGATGVDPRSDRVRAEEVLGLLAAPGLPHCRASPPEPCSPSHTSDSNELPGHIRPER